MRPPEARAVAIAVHDVSPATWHECRELLAMLDDVGASPLSLLIVPHYHYRAEAARSRAFVRAMDARLARGDELVLHGFYHLDDAPPPRTPPEWFARRMLTQAEGEFAALDEAAAAWRLARGIALFARLGWPLHGFVPPAWLMSEGARAALANCGHPFEYVTVKGGIHYLPQWHLERTANLWYSPGSAARRLLSVGAIRRELWRARSAPLLRVSLHPQDARVPQVLRHWRLLVLDALRERAAVTKRGWVSRIRDRDGAALRARGLPLRDASTRAAADVVASPVRAVS